MNDFISERPIVKKYFKIGEVSEILKESISCVRHWGKEFEIGHRSFVSQWRVFTRTDIAKLHMVKQLLRDEKYTLKGAKNKLKLINI